MAANPLLSRGIRLAFIALLLVACGGGGGGGGGSSGGEGSDAGGGGNGGGDGAGTVEAPADSPVDAVCSKPLENPLELAAASLSLRSASSTDDGVPVTTIPLNSNFAPNRLIVKLKSNADSKAGLQSRSAPTVSSTSIAGIRLSPLGTVSLKGEVQIKSLSSGGAAMSQAVAQSTSLFTAQVQGGEKALSQAKKNLQASHLVESVEYDYEQHLSASSVASKGVAAAANGGAGAIATAPQSAVSASGEPIVAVIDTGIYAAHPDLASNMWRNSGEIAGNGVDDDGDGYVDNLYGADVVEFSGNTNPHENTSSKNHGTQVAGVIRNATRASEALGAKVKIMALKVQGSNGLIYTSDVIRAHNFILQKKMDGHNIVSVNRSMGCYSCASLAMEASLQALIQAGVLVVNSAGNESRDTATANFYPSAYRLPGLVSVASHNAYGSLSSFSNYGSHVDIAALGESVTTTSGPSGTASVRGTSFASPYVAGVAAMAKVQNPSLSLAALKMRVLSRGYDSTQGTACQLHGLVPSNKLASVKLSINPASCTSPKPVIVYPSHYLSPADSYWGDMRNHSQNIFTAGATHLLAAQVEVCTGQTQGLNFTSSDGQVVAARDDGVYPDKMARDGLYTALYAPSSSAQPEQTLSVQAVHLLGNEEIKSEAKEIRIAQSGVYKASVDSVAFKSIAATGTKLAFTVSSTGFSQAADENVSVPFPIFFSGAWQNEFYASNSGRICFQYALAKYNKGAFCNAPPWYKDALPNGWRQNDGNASYNQTILGMIAPWWDTQWGSGNTGVYIQAEGSAPNRRFIVSWEGMRPTTVAQSNAATASFQIVFFEGQRHFNIVYGNTVIGNYGPSGTYNMDNGITATVGVQHYSGKTGLTLSYQNAGSAQTHGVFSNRSYRYDYVQSAFSDVVSGEKSAVNAVVGAALADGCAPDKFCPNEVLSRAHAAAWVGRVAFGNDFVSDYFPPIASQFSDVRTDSPYFRHIHAIQSLNAFGSCGAGTFCPDAPVNTSELVKFVYKRVALHSIPDLTPAMTLTRRDASVLFESIARPQDYFY